MWRGASFRLNERRLYAEVAETYGNESPVRETAEGERKLLALLSHLRLLVTTPVREECWLEKTLHVWVEHMNRESASPDVCVLCQKAPSRYEDFSQGASEMSVAGPFTASTGWLRRLRISYWRSCGSDNEAAANFWQR